MIDNLNLEDHTENPKTKVNWFKVRKNQYMFATVVVVVILLVGILMAILNMPKDTATNSTQLKIILFWILINRKFLIYNQELLKIHKMLLHYKS